MLRVVREDGFDFMSREYCDLFARSDATLLQHPVWLQRLYGSLAPARHATPVVITMRSPDDDRLLAVLPLMRRRRGIARTVEFADLGVCDYAAPIIDPDVPPRELEDPGLTTAVRDAVGAADLIQAEKVVDPQIFGRSLGNTAWARHGFDTHTIALRAPFEHWRTTTLDPSFVRHLDRKRKRLRPKGELTLRTVTDTNEIDEAMVQMQSFRRARFAGRRAVDLMQDADCFDFYCQVAKDSARFGGPGRTSVLTLGDTIVAASFGLADTERHLFLLVGFDFERYRNYSLGLLIVEELIAEAIGRGLHTFDLTVGNEGYKADFGAEARTMHLLRDAGTVRGHLATAAAVQNAAARRLAKRALAHHYHLRSKHPVKQLALLRSMRRG